MRYLGFSGVGSLSLCDCGHFIRVSEAPQVIQALEGSELAFINFSATCDFVKTLKFFPRDS